MYQGRTHQLVEMNEIWMSPIMRLAEPRGTIYLLRFSGIDRSVATSYNICVYIGYDHRAISFKNLTET